MAIPEKPISRIEHYLARANGQNVQPPDPISRIEHYLAGIAGGVPQELLDDVADLKSQLETNAKLYKSGSILNKFDVRIFDTDIGYAPQGLAVWGDKAYVSNGVDTTPPINAITEIDISTGQTVRHLIDGLDHGANCLTIDYASNVLYASDHNTGGIFYAINMDTWEIIKTYDVTSIVQTQNLAYDPFENCFYIYSVGSSAIYKIDKSGNLIDTISIDTTSDKYPVHNPGTGQGMGYDGTYFYIMRSEVEALYGNSIVLVYDKTGKIVTYFNGDHDEIEDIGYDFTTGKYYACYAKGATGYITKYVDDTGWLNLYDYLSGSYSQKAESTNIGSGSTIKFRVYNGMLMFKGDLIVNEKASGMSDVATYVDARITAPSSQNMCIMRKANNILTPTIVQYPFFNPYISKFKQPYLPIYSAEIGTLSINLTVPFGLQVWD